MGDIYDAATDNALYDFDDDGYTKVETRRIRIESKHTIFYIIATIIILTIILSLSQTEAPV